MRQEMLCESETIALFKKELWKDRRTIDVDIKNGNLYKHYEDKQELTTEISIAELLNSQGISGIPSIRQANRQVNDFTSSMEYYRGIRFFNLFVILDTIRPCLKNKSCTKTRCMVS